MSEQGAERMNRRRPVYLCESDWDLVCAALQAQLGEPYISKDAKVLWDAGAARARYIVSEIQSRKAAP